ncbi:induced myeloid leukemia cell differentiation protein Mcl-1 [Huso huso]|uniref:Induced myeloid leukemia cell differentiation protein Mcl-1 n=1 Tax=Huso huso TaxID=61971 RepID=A0ABR0Y5L3_HUSHU
MSLYCPSQSELNGPFEQTTRDLISEYLTGLPYYNTSEDRHENKPLVTLKRVANIVIEKHQSEFNEMLCKLRMGQGTGVDFVEDVAENMFKDGITNWGRIVTLLAFGTVFVNYLKENALEHDIERLGEKISDFLIREKRTWILKNGGWQGFVDFFHIKVPDSSVPIFMLIFIGLVKIGAIIMFLMK